MNEHKPAYYWDGPHCIILQTYCKWDVSTSFQDGQFCLWKIFPADPMEYPYFHPTWLGMARHGEPYSNHHFLLTFYSRPTPQWYGGLLGSFCSKWISQSNETRRHRWISVAAPAAKSWSELCPLWSIEWKRLGTKKWCVDWHSACYMLYSCHRIV